MSRIDLPPTRSNLLRLKQDLLFARQGYEILDRKREVLTSELLRIAHDTESLEAQAGQLAASAYRALEKARLTVGQERIEWAALAVKKTRDVKLTFRGVMGVSLPRAASGGEAGGIPFSLGDTNAALDEAARAFREWLDRIPEVAELAASVWILAGELRKTLRRVNALEYIFIPDYEQSIAFIIGALEEHEREEIFRLKRLKVRMARTRSGENGSEEAANGRRSTGF